MSNSNCTCATTRLLELRMYGVYQYTLTERLERIASTEGITGKLYHTVITVQQSKSSLLATGCGPKV